MSKSKLFVASALALVGVLGTGVARANHGADVQWSVTIGTPIGVPIYTEPYPVYQQPYPSQYYYGGYQQPYQYQQPYHRHHRHHGQPSRWDRDGDGIPNRRDPIYNPRWDRDGDGIPNWQDRRDGGYWRGR